MLIKLKENWQLWGPGAIVDVYYGIGKELIQEGKAVDVEKSESQVPMKPESEVPKKFDPGPGYLPDNVVNVFPDGSSLWEVPDLAEPKPDKKSKKVKKPKKKDTSFDLH